MNARNKMTPARRRKDRLRLVMHSILCARMEFPNWRPHHGDRAALIRWATQYGTCWKITKKEVEAVLKMRVDKALSIPPR